MKTQTCIRCHRRANHSYQQCEGAAVLPMCGLHAAAERRRASKLGFQRRYPQPIIKKDIT